MKKNHYRVVLGLLLICGASTSGQVPQVISYQGKVSVNGTNFTGTGQFKFALVNGPGTVSYWSNDGTSAGGSQPTAAVVIDATNGLFSVMLGDTSLANMTIPIPIATFTNADVRLRLWFSEAGSSFQQLSPDQRIGSVGYAMQAAKVATGGAVTRVDTGSGLTGGPITATGMISIANSSIANAMLANPSLTITAGSGLSGGGSVALGGSTALSLNLANPNAWIGTQSFQSMAGNGGGLTNLNALTLEGLRASNFWKLAGNGGSTAGINFLGTTDNQALELKVNNQRAFRLEPTTNTPNVIGGFAGNYVGSNVFGTTISGGGGNSMTNLVDAATWSPNGGPIPANFGTLGGGAGNSIAGSDYSTISGGLSNSIFSANYTYKDENTIGGGAGNSMQNARNSVIAGGETNSISADKSNPLHYSTIGGGSGNKITDGCSEGSGGGTIAGGYGNGIRGAFDGPTIGGGSGNSIGCHGDSSTIGGGAGNRISSYSQWATIGGGGSNNIDGLARGATIGGGMSNQVVHGVGGSMSTAMSFATIPGGLYNTATNFAFAAGRRAKAVHEGAFVWADSTEADFASTANNQFLIRAFGGVGIGTPSPDAMLDIYGTRNISSTSDGIVNIGDSAGVHLTLDNNELHAKNGANNSMLYLNYFGGDINLGNAGLTVAYGSGVAVNASSSGGYRFYVNGTAYCTAGAWSGSDVRWKKNIQPLSGALDKVLQLRGVSYEWRRDEFPGLEFGQGAQLGFVAQEIEKVLPELVNTDDKGYKAVAYEKLTPVLAEAIKEQQGQLREQQSQIQKLQADNAKLAESVAELKSLLSRLIANQNGGEQ